MSAPSDCASADGVRWRHTTARSVAIVAHLRQHPRTKIRTKPQAAGVPGANIFESGCVTAISLSTSDRFSNAGWIPVLFPPEKASLHTMAGSSLRTTHNRAAPRIRMGMVIIWRSMNVIVNGQERQFPELSAEAKLSNVIDSLALKGDRIAVEHNGVIVPRPEWESVAVASGDKLEIVHFVGGGAF